MKKYLILISLFSIGIGTLDAQNALEQLGKRVLQRAGEQVEERVEQRAEEGVEHAMDKAEEVVRHSGNTTNVNADDQATSQAPSTSVEKSTPSTPNPQPTLQSFSQYDFVPGDQVLLFEDFSQDAIGDFPTHWTTDGSGEVKQLNLAEGKWLHMNVVDKKYQYLQNFVLPDNYIVEFDLIVVPSDEVNPSAVVFAMYQGETSDPGIIDPSLSGLRLQMAHDRWYVQCYHESGWIDGSSELSPVGRNTPEHVIVWVQRRRMRVYHAGQKVMDLPTILPADFKPNRLMFDLWDTSQGTGFLTNLRVTTASPDTRSKLIEEGKLISYGIYFDLNSDKIKPESYGALHDIAAVIQQEKVKVQITGHTDNSGSDAVNLDLSKRRAASVKAELVKLGVSADALTTDGAGASNPIAANDTPSNMALNRRVEFVKQ